MFTFKDFAIKKQETKLNNGLPLVHFYKKGAPIYMKTFIAAGGKFAPDGKEGISHFLEHMIVAGSKNFKSKDKLALFIEKTGGYFSAYTNAERVAVNVAIATEEDIDIASKVLYEILQNTSFDDKVLETERGSIIQEIGDYESTPSRWVWDVSSELVFQDTNNKKSILGTVEDVKAITKQDLINYRDKYFNSNNMVIVTAGDISIDKLKESLNRHLNIKAGEKYVSTKSLPIIRDKKVAIKEYKDSEQIHLIYSFRINSKLEEHKKLLQIFLANRILGGGRTSLLIKKLRYETGLVYGAGSFLTKFTDSSSWDLKTSTNKENLDKVLKIIQEELKTFKENGLAKDQLEFVKNRYIKASRMDMESASDWADFHANEALSIPDKTLDFPDYLNMIESIKLDEINKTIKENFDIDNWYLSICGDVNEKDINLEIIN